MAAEVVLTVTDSEDVVTFSVVATLVSRLPKNTDGLAMARAMSVVLVVSPASARSVRAQRQHEASARSVSARRQRAAPALLNSGLGRIAGLHSSSIQRSHEPERGLCAAILRGGGVRRSAAPTSGGSL